MNGSRDVGTRGHKCFSRTAAARTGAQDSRRAGPARGPRGQVQPQGASPCAPSPSRRLPGSRKVAEPPPRAGSREPGGGGGGGVAAVLSPRGRGGRRGPAAALSSASQAACGRAGAGRRRPRSDMWPWTAGPGERRRGPASAAPGAACPVRLAARRSALGRKACRVRDPASPGPDGGRAGGSASGCYETARPATQVAVAPFRVIFQGGLGCFRMLSLYVKWKRRLFIQPLRVRCLRRAPRWLFIIGHFTSGE